jgi:hypothetical protein
VGQFGLLDLMLHLTVALEKEKDRYNEQNIRACKERKDLRKVRDILLSPIIKIKLYT